MPRNECLSHYLVVWALQLLPYWLGTKYGHNYTPSTYPRVQELIFTMNCENQLLNSWICTGCIIMSIFCIGQWYPSTIYIHKRILHYNYYYSYYYHYCGSSNFTAYDCFPMGSNYIYKLCNISKGFSSSFAIKMYMGRYI